MANKRVVPFSTEGVSATALFAFQYSDHLLFLIFQVTFFTSLSPEGSAFAYWVYCIVQDGVGFIVASRIQDVFKEQHGVVLSHSLFIIKSSFPPEAEDFLPVFKSSHGLHVSEINCIKQTDQWSGEDCLVCVTNSIKMCCTSSGLGRLGEEHEESLNMREWRDIGMFQSHSVHTELPSEAG